MSIDTHRYQRAALRLVELIDADEWHLGNDVLTADEVAATDDLLPIWVLMAADNARDAGLITDIDQFPITTHFDDNGTFGVVAEASGKNGDIERLPDSVGLLFVTDALYNAMAMSDRNALNARRVIDLTPAVSEVVSQYALENDHGERPTEHPSPVGD